jgi:hypothetical protein
MMRASALDNASASCTLRTSRDARALAKNAASYVSFLRAQGGHCSALCMAGGGAPEVADVHARPRHSAAAELDAGQEFVEELPRAAALLPKCARAAYLRPQHATPLVHLRGREGAGRNARRWYSTYFRQSHPLVPVVLRPSASNFAPNFKGDHPAQAREHVGAVDGVRILHSTC